MPELTALGELLEQAREARRLSKREAARRAGISEGRWRQVVTGIHRAGDTLIPVNPRSSTVTAMARAVGVDLSVALRAAGLPVIVEARAEAATGQGVAYDATVNTVEGLIQEIYADPNMPDERKHEHVRLIRQAEAQAEAERQAARDELNSWRHRRAAG